MVFARNSLNHRELIGENRRFSRKIEKSKWLNEGRLKVCQEKFLRKNKVVDTFW